MSEQNAHYLVELRQRVIRCLFGLAGLTLVTVYFANGLYTGLARPLLRQLAQGQQFIATDITSAFFTPFEFAFYVAIFLSVPLFFYQIWAFVAPALYRHEKRMAKLFLIASIGLFYGGIVFAYLVIFPLIFSFLTRTAPAGVQVMPDIAKYLAFSMKMFILFGLMFETPVVFILLVKLKMLTRDKLIRLRPYVIVGAFIISMCLAPPDVLSQICVALPLWWLYEISVFLLKFIP